MEQLCKVQNALMGNLEKVSEPIPLVDQQKEIIVQLIGKTILDVETILPSTTNVSEIDKIDILRSSLRSTKFQYDLARFLTTALKNYGKHIEYRASKTWIIEKTLKYLLILSYVEHSQVFEICIEFWEFLLDELCTETLKTEFSRETLKTVVYEGEFARNELPFYVNLFPEICEMVVKKMKNPDDVHIWKDQNDLVVRDTMKNTFALLLQDNLTNCLSCLTKMKRRTVEKSIIKVLTEVISDEKYQNIPIVKPICWSTGAFIKFLWHNETEKYKTKFIAQITTELMKLSKKLEDDHDKSILIGTGIMYITAVCPSCWNKSADFMAVVLAKILECMQSTHLEVREAACDSLVRITKEAPNKFLIAQGDEPIPYIEVLFSHMNAITGLFVLPQFLMFCEAVSYIIAAELDAFKREQFVNRILEYPLQCWNVILAFCAQKPETFYQNGPALALLAALKTYVLVFEMLSPDSSIESQLVQICEKLPGLYSAASKYIFSYNSQYPDQDKDQNIKNLADENQRHEEQDDEGVQALEPEPEPLEPLLLEPMCSIRLQCDKLIELRTAMRPDDEDEDADDDDDDGFLAWQQQIASIRQEFPCRIESVMPESGVDMSSDSDSKCEMETAD